MFLLIVESPSKCAIIESYLNETGPAEWKCIASKGHIRDIDNLKNISFDEKNKRININYAILKEKEKHVDLMKKTISKYSYSDIFIATDNDREGEAIGWHICIVFNLPVETTKRIIFQEITKPAIRKAIITPTTINMNIVFSQQARQVFDMVIGYKISPFLWKYIYSDKSSSLSAGRCQTPALRLVYDSAMLSSATSVSSTETNIKYTISASFFSYNLIYYISIESETTPSTFSITEEDINSFFTKSTEEKYKFFLSKETNLLLQKSPLPFNTSSLLQKSSSLLKLSPKQTMMYCSQLYQEGFITYMRTENKKYSIEFLKKVEKYSLEKMSQYSGEKNLRDTKDIVNTDFLNPHEAIRPTNIYTTEYFDNNGGDVAVIKAKLYKLIWKNTLRSCLKDAIYERYLSTISCPAVATKTSVQYINHLDIPKQIGWKLVDFLEDEKKRCTETNESDDEYEINENNSPRKEETLEQYINRINGILFYLKSIPIGSIISSHNYIIVSPFINYTKSILYSESSLIQELEKKGIGRPSTFAGIIETIKDRGYVKNKNIEGQKIVCFEYKCGGSNSVPVKKEIIKKIGFEKNKLIIENIGILTTDFLTKYFDSIFSYDYTKNMEDKLDSFPNENVEKYYYEICFECFSNINELSKQISKFGKKKFKIDEKHELFFHKNGPVIQRIADGKFISVRKNIFIDFHRFSTSDVNAYKLEDLVEIQGNGFLGKYLNENVFLKSGPYGKYLEWNGVRKSIKDAELSIFQEIKEDCRTEMFSRHFSSSIEEIIPSIISAADTKKGIVRIINTDISIRNGRYGNYIFYKTEKMKTPKFIKIPSKLKKKILTDDASNIEKIIYDELI